MSTQPPDTRLTFRLKGFTPETLPLNVFAEYVTGLAALLGTPKELHFVQVKKGSAEFVHDVNHDALLCVRDRIHAVKMRQAPEDAIAGFNQIHQLLLRDRGSASITLGRAKLLEFPAQKTVLESPIGPITQLDYLDGQLIRVGGKDETVPVQIRDEDGVVHSCTANIAVARELSPCLYRQTMRVNGTGHWYRHGDGKWVLQFFRIANFEPLDDSPMPEAVEAIRDTDTSDWPADIEQLLTDMRAQE